VSLRYMWGDEPRSLAICSVVRAEGRE
jgi:hypothetical protein